MYKTKHKEAYALLNEANRIDPYNIEVLLHLARVQSKLNPNNPLKMQKILYRIQSLLDTPRNDTDKFHLAQTSFLIAVYEKPIDIELLKDARTIFDEIGRRDWKRHCDDLIDNESTNYVNAKTLNKKGSALEALGKYDQAIECFDKAIEIDPSDGKMWNKKGSALELWENMIRL